MKKQSLVILISIISISTYSQIDFGVRAGLNMNFSKAADILGDFNFERNSENDFGYF